MSRAKWKGPYIHPKDLKIFKKSIKTIPKISRNSEIVPQFLNLTLQVYTGKSYIEIIITEEMVGHKFGEFAFTRAKFSFKKKSKV